ncbi:MAG: Translation initiation factor 2, partial [Myxococcaceae bacterium]|nr:Translation initiation factor 2 [Myxococcaceae bacterium]
AHAATTPPATTPRGPAGRTTPATNATPATPATPANPGGVAEATPPAPMLIYTAAVDLSVRRAEITATLDRVVDLAYAMGGYLVQRTDAQVQVRVPSARFREGVRRVEELADVLHRTINAQDVSEEFNDLEVRLANLRAVRRRLEEFLARAANVAEALRVEQELERVSREMDQIEGRMRFLRARATFSLVTVTAVPRSEAVVAPDPLPGPSVRRPLDLPVEWLDRLGLGRLLQIR